MSFDRAWMLVFVLLPLAWAWRQWPRTGRRRGLILKTLCFLCLAVALAGPVLPVSETKVAVTVLADTSASLTEQDLERATGIIGSLEGARGRHWMRVLPFAREVRDLTPEEQKGGFQLRLTGGDQGRATDIEAALRDATGVSPAGLVPRFVLLSDGKENLGSIARAAWLARELSVPVDTFLLAGRKRPVLRLDAVRMPQVAFSGERFPVEMVVTSPRAASVRVEVSAEGQPLGTNTVQIDAGSNSIQLTPSLDASGVVELSGGVRGEGLGEVRFAQAVSLRRPRLLFVTGDVAGMERDLADALRSAQFEITVRHETPAEPFENYQLVVFNNWDLSRLADAMKNDLQEYVRQGGGLLVIGGENNLYVEKTTEDPVEQALPAKVAPPRSPEGTSVVLIVDKSSSMEGRKMELARQAAIGVIANLRPIDRVGVLIFDNTFEWAVPIRLADDKATIQRTVAGIAPDGGTQIAPALAEAYRRTLPVEAPIKHIVLLTDGISEEGDSMNVAQSAAQQHVTISTVGLGQDVNRDYLARIATLAKGKSYLVTELSNLEQILLRDVQEFTGSTAVEKELKAEVTQRAEILDGVPVEFAPTLKGYVRFEAKPTADTILRVEEDPLLARWQYGLGRAAVFSSDAKARWAAGWVNWDGFDRLWANIARDLLPRSQPSEAELRFDSATGELVASYRFGRHLPDPARAPAIYALGPEGFHQPVPMRKVAAGSWRGSVPIGSRKGLFRVLPIEESRAFPEVGLYVQDDELNEYGSNEELLRQLSDFTGGRFQPAASQVFDAGGRSIPSSMALWPGLIGLAILFNLAELIDRKWKGITDLFRK